MGRLMCPPAARDVPAVALVLSKAQIRESS